MPIDEDQLAKIRKLNRWAVEAMVAELYPQLYRIAAGLTGQEDVALGTLRFLFKQSIDAMSKWKDEDAPQRYYLHHLILLTRRSRKHAPELRQDLLIDRSVDSAEYRAFLVGLRKLHFQQQEAFILTHGEKLNARFLAVAMDCSIQAATNHLKAAEESLKLIAGERFAFLTSELSKVYRSHQSSADGMLPKLKDDVGRRVGRIKFWRAVKWISIVIAWIALIYGGWMVWKMMEY